MEFKDLQTGPGPSLLTLAPRHDCTTDRSLPEPPQALVVTQGFRQSLGPLVTHLVAPEPEKVNRWHRENLLCSRSALVVPSLARAPASGQDPKPREVSVGLLAPSKGRLPSSFWRDSPTSFRLFGCFTSDLQNSGGPPNAYPRGQGTRSRGNPRL